MCDKKYVYFLEGAGMIKIGTTAHLEKRYAEIQGMSPVDLELVAYTEGDEKLEKEYHRRFAQYRMHGEWFLSMPELWEAIDEINWEA